jgi:2-hydroxychromene-2-carboxylate isomerase
MTTHVEFFFDVGSPTAYLAWQRLRQLEAAYDMALVFRPMLLGGVFKATENASPVTIPAKGRYMMEQDLPRFARRYDVPLNPNPWFPINTLALMRGAIAASDMGVFDRYLPAVFQAMWVDAKNLNLPDVVAEVLTEAGLEAEALLAATQDPEVKAKLIANTEEAVERGAFGAPTLFIGDEMYFGQDRLDFVEEVLRAAA